MTIKIKSIEALATYSVRHPVLRTGKPQESCRFEGDDLDTTHHLGLFVNEQLVGVVTLMRMNHSFFQDQIQFQMRGMAVLPEFQGKGLGAQLVLKAEEYVRNQASTILWFNARESAVLFYKKMKFNTIGVPFEIKEISRHYVMFKALAS
jgi:GNAT superfamily N-acetyltransferase